MQTAINTAPEPEPEPAPIPGATPIDTLIFNENGHLQTVYKELQGIPFVAIPRFAIDALHQNLTAFELKLLGTCLSFTPYFMITPRYLAKRLHRSVSAIHRALSNLKKMGFAMPVAQRNRSSGGFTRWQWVFAAVGFSKKAFLEYSRGPKKIKKTERNPAVVHFAHTGHMATPPEKTELPQLPKADVANVEKTNEFTSSHKMPKWNLLIRNNNVEQKTTTAAPAAAADFSVAATAGDATPSTTSAPTSPEASATPGETTSPDPKTAVQPVVDSLHVLISPEKRKAVGKRLLYKMLLNDGLTEGQLKYAIDQLNSRTLKTLGSAGGYLRNIIRNQGTNLIDADVLESKRRAKAEEAGRILREREAAQAAREQAHAEEVRAAGSALETELASLGPVDREALIKTAISSLPLAKQREVRALPPEEQLRLPTMKIVVGNLLKKKRKSLE